MGKKQVSVITPGFPISQVPQFYIVSVGGCVWKVSGKVYRLVLLKWGV